MIHHDLVTRLREAAEVSDALAGEVSDIGQPFLAGRVAYGAEGLAWVAGMIEDRYRDEGEQQALDVAAVDGGGADV